MRGIGSFVSVASVLVIVGFLTLAAAPVWAEVAATAASTDEGLMKLVPVGPQSAKEESGQEKSAPAVPYKAGDKAIAPEFQEVDYPTLVRLAWSLGVHKIESDEDVDAYLMVSECSLYEKYYKNEFQWEKLRKAARQYLQKYGSSVSHYYEYTQTIKLGRYDANLQGFPIANVQNYTSLKSLQIANYKSGATSCGQLGMDSTKYPGAGMVNILSPLSLTFIRVPKDLAMEYIGWRNDQGFSESEARQAYVRFRVRVDGFVGIETVLSSPSYVFYGKLLELDVFADKEMMMPLYNQMF